MGLLGLVRIQRAGNMNRGEAEGEGEFEVVESREGVKSSIPIPITEPSFKPQYFAETVSFPQYRPITVLHSLPARS